MKHQLRRREASAFAGVKCLRRKREAKRAFYIPKGCIISEAASYPKDASCADRRASFCGDDVSNENEAPASPA